MSVDGNQPRICQAWLFIERVPPKIVMDYYQY